MDKMIFPFRHGNFEVLEMRSELRGKSSPRYETRLLCRCVCGKTKWFPKYAVMHDRIKSCGCITASVKHGGTNTRLYNIWCGIKRRCNVPTSPMYRYYGARGIRICPEWEHDFAAFRDWSMLNGYEESLTIDRVDVDGGYSPFNCRWATYAQQARNKRSNHRETAYGKTLTLSEWEYAYGIKHGRLNGMLKRYPDMPFEEMLNLAKAPGRLRLSEADCTPKRFTVHVGRSDVYGTVSELLELLAGMLGIRTSTLRIFYNRYGHDMQAAVDAVIEQNALAERQTGPLQYIPLR